LSTFLFSCTKGIAFLLEWRRCADDEGHWDASPFSFLMLIGQHLILLCPCYILQLYIYIFPFLHTRHLFITKNAEISASYSHKVTTYTLPLGVFSNITLSHCLCHSWCPLRLSVAMPIRATLMLSTRVSSIARPLSRAASIMLCVGGLPESYSAFQGLTVAPRNSNTYISMTEV